MKINRDTTCCISIAEHPGNFGATIFNTVFQKMNLNYIYKPFCVNNKNLSEAIEGIRAFNIRGCGVSMPHKTTVMQYLDKIDGIARKIGAVNTIVNNNGVLIGYNTDYEGVKKAVQEIHGDLKGQKILIVGAGGIARAAIEAFKDGGAGEIWLTNRDEKKGKKITKEFAINYCPFNKKENFNGQILMNATPVGMLPDTGTIIDKKNCTQYNTCVDVVVSRCDTDLIKTMRNMGKVVVPGFKIALYQGIAQFKLYTGINVPEKTMKIALNTFLQNNF